MYLLEREGEREDMRDIVVVTCPVCTFELVPVTAVLWKCDMDYFGLLQLAGTEYYYYCGVEERYVFSLVVVATGHKIISSSSSSAFAFIFAASADGFKFKKSAQFAH